MSCCGISIPEVHIDTPKIDINVKVPNVSINEIKKSIKNTTKQIHKTVDDVVTNKYVQKISEGVTTATGGVLNTNKILEGVDEMSTFSFRGISKGFDDVWQGTPAHFLLSFVGVDTHKEVITNGQFVRINKSNSLFKKNYINVLGGNEKNPQTAINMLLMQKSSKQNFNIFDKFELNTKPSGTLYSVDTDAIEAYLVNVLNYNNVTVKKYKVESSYMYKQYTQIENKFYKKDLFEQELKQKTSYGDLSEDVGIYKISGSYCKPRTNDVDDDTTYVKERYDSDNDIHYLQFDNIQLNKTDEFTGDGSTDTFDLEDYSIIINSVTINDDDVDSSTYKLLKSFDTGSQIQFDTAPADQDDIKVDFDYLDDSNDDLVEIEKNNDENVTYLVDMKSDEYTGILFIYKDKIDKIISETRFLQIQLKNDGKIIKNTQHMKVALNFFGTKQKDFNDILNNDDIVDVFITYSATWSDPLFKEALEYIYGTADNPKSVIINNNNTELRYWWLEETIYDDDGNVVGHEILRCASMNGKALDITKQIYMIPLQSIKYHTLKEFFEIQAKNLSFGIFSSQEHTVQWYQTEAFMDLTTAITVGVAVVTQQWYLLGAMAGVYVVEQSNLPDWLKATLEVALIIAGGYKQAVRNAIIAGGTYTISAMDISMYSLQVANITVTTYLKVQMKKEQDKINNKKNELNNLNNQLEEAKNNAYMYNPFQKYDDYWNTMYNAPYDPYSYVSLSTNPNFGVGHTINL